MEKKHALLSPSGASRWIACTPSARLEMQFPDRAGDAAKEGTLAHSIGELIINLNLKRISQVAFNKELKKFQADKLYDNSMLDYADDYATHVVEKYAEAISHTKDAIIYLEQKLNLTDYIPESFGTGDAVIIADTTLSIIDLKYGKGVPVSCENNRQMMLYALGALKEFDYMYDIREVSMTIYQPRIDNISTWIAPVELLHKWSKDELIPRAALAFKGEGDFVPGNHCQFCRARSVCKVNANYQMELAKYDFKESPLLTDDEVADILTRQKSFENWLTAVSDYALHEAVNNGKKWPGHKVVEGRSNRKYSDEDVVATKLMKAGFAEELIYTRKLLGITAMEKELTKKVFLEQLSGLITKPPGKPALVSEDDKRPEYHSNEAAKKDFETVEAQ